MAAIGKIRSWGPILITILAIALLGFIAETAFETLSKKKAMDSRTAGFVDGQKVDIEDFNKQVEEFQQILKFQGQTDLGEDDMNGLRDYVWESYIRNQVIEKEAKELGLSVTEEELAQVLKDGTNPALMQVQIINQFVNQQTRRFDYTQVTAAREYLRQMAAQAQSEEQRAMAQEQADMLDKVWPVAEKLLRQQLLINKYQSLIEGCVGSNPISARANFDASNTESSVLLASLPYAEVNDNDVEVSDAELKAKYDEQKRAYKTYRETREIKYVAYQIVASEADRALVSKTISEAEAALRADSLKPAEIVRAAQSQVPYTGFLVTRAALSYDVASKVDSLSVGQVSAPFVTASDNTMNVVKLISKVQAPDSIEYRFIRVDGTKAKETADSIVRVLRAGEVFDSVAVKFGQPGTRMWAVSKDYQNTMLDMDTKAFLSALNKAGQDELQVLELSQGASLVYQVTSRRAIVDKYDVAIVKCPINFSTETYNKAYNDFTQYVSESQNIAGLEEKAPEAGYVVLDRIIKPGDHNIAGLRGSRDALRWAFNDAKEGELSEVIPCGDNDHLLVVAVSRINEPGYLSEESVKEQLKQQVLRDKKFDLLAQKFNGIANISAAETAGAHVDTIPLITFDAPAYIPSLGVAEPALSGAVAGTEPGKMSKSPVKGLMSAYMFQVIDRHQRTGVEYNEKAQQDALRQKSVQQVRNLMSQDLINSVEVEDFRYNFF